MNEFESNIKVGTPIYLITSTERCWKCRLLQTVIALASCSIADEEGEEAIEDAGEIEPFILNETNQQSPILRCIPFPSRKETMPCRSIKLPDACHMSDKRKNAPDEETGRLKNPSPIGTQHNPVSSPGDTSNPVEKELAEREKFQREEERRRAADSE